MKSQMLCSKNAPNEQPNPTLARSTREMSMRSAFQMTEAQVREHQEKHGFGIPNSTVTKTPTPSVTKRQRMTKVEAEYGMILESMKRRHEIVDWQFEGITFRLADDCRYTPDFFVIVTLHPLLLRFVETKGKHIWDDSKVKFRVAKEKYPWAEWCMWQKKSSGWERVL